MESITKKAISGRRTRPVSKKKHKKAAETSKGVKSPVIAAVKSALVGTALSVVLIVIYALLLYKQILLSDSMAIANATIKVLSAALAAIVAVRGQSQKRYLIGGMAGIMYTLAAFIIFSLLSSTFNISLALLSDIAMGMITGMLSIMIMNMVKS
ncbi:MAG: TIGR04086 family membrane protein [Clostridia bacterium]|nr:TIGR04086 family membrane protein [Clostridia bacterium]